MSIISYNLTLLRAIDKLQLAVNSGHGHVLLLADADGSYAVSMHPGTSLECRCSEHPEVVWVERDGQTDSDAIEVEVLDAVECPEK